MRTQELDQRVCFFAILDAASGRGGERRRELLYQFESVLPQSVEELQVAFSKPLHGKVIACGCLKSLVQQYRSKAEILVPESLPIWLGTDPNDSRRTQLNLLTGSMLPASTIRRTRITARVVCAAAILGCAGLYAGVQAKSAHFREQRKVFNEQIESMYETILPKSSGPNIQPDAIRFQTLLNLARSTRTETVRSNEHDLVNDLATVFGDWPSASESRVQSISVNSDTLRMQISVPDNDSATELIQNLTRLVGWTIQTRSTTPRSDSVDLDVTFARSAPQEQSS